MLVFGTDNAEVNACSRLAPFVMSIEDDPDNRLRIVIALPKNSSSLPFPAEPPELQNILAGAVHVTEDRDRMYEILFEHYILYQCRNESYADIDPGAAVHGRYLVILDHSLLLEYCEQVTIDILTREEASRRKHYGIYTENHTIDVISIEPPLIRKLHAE